MTSREGEHLFVYPFEGRLVHEGLSALFAYLDRPARAAHLHLRLERLRVRARLPSRSADRAGARPAGCSPASTCCMISPASLNAVELARRQFLEIARVAGLVFPGYPGSPKTLRQVQASSGLLYDVFTRYDPGNLLIHRAQREVLERQLEQTRLGGGGAKEWSECARGG
ncbi:MAG: hypothetical protein U0133_06330 [Gemmatimonadales bacterium]